MIKVSYNNKDVPVHVFTNIYTKNKVNDYKVNYPFYNLCLY